MDLPRYHTCASPPTCRIYVHPFRNSFGLIDRRRLSRDTRLTSDSCSSGWCFAIGFLHRGRCLPRLAELLVLPLFGRTADFHRIDTCALLGARRQLQVRVRSPPSVRPHHQVSAADAIPSCRSKPSASCLTLNFLRRSRAAGFGKGVCRFWIPRSKASIFMRR